MHVSVATNLTSATAAHPGDSPLRDVARELEASFLTEMLKALGLGKSRGFGGGGAGEDQFSGFLVRELAGSMAKSGGIGLQEAIFQSLAGAEK